MTSASDFFHREENLNCAQAVLKYFNAPPEKIAEYKAFGGGRAPEGLCGALHAARLLVDDEEKFRNLLEEFAARSGGAITCRALKNEAGFPCPACVNLAAELVEKHTVANELTVVSKGLEGGITPPPVSRKPGYAIRAARRRNADTPPSIPAVPTRH